jgi:hypothetical protein
MAWLRVVRLLSPPRTPGYNGAVEVGMRWLEPRTEPAARRAGHGGVLRSAFGERVAAEERELRAGLEGAPDRRESATARRVRCAVRSLRTVFSWS